MASDTIFLKDNLAGSVPTEIATEVIKNITTNSLAMNIMKSENMKSDKKNLVVSTKNGKAFWVEEGTKIGTSVNEWEYPQLVTKKLAVIIPVTREKTLDSVINVMEELKTGISSQFVKAIDSALFFGTDSPFTQNIFDVANAITDNAITATTEITKDISAAMGKVEAEDLMCSNIVAPTAFKQTLRDAVDKNGNALITNDGTVGEKVFNTPVSVLTHGAFDKTKAQLLVGDFTKAIIGLRDGIEYTVMKEGTVGDINLGERDMIAIKATMRIGFVVADSKAFALVKPASN